MHTLKHLLVTHPHSIVASSPIYRSDSAVSGEMGRDKRRQGSNIFHNYTENYTVYKQNSNKLTAFKMIVLSLMSATDLENVAATTARLLRVCNCSLMATPLTAPLKF